MSESTVQDASPMSAEVSAGLKKLGLPIYFNGGMLGILKNAARLDKEYAHYWVKSVEENYLVRRQMGWEPYEDKERLMALGLRDLIRADGRAHFGDLELWRMPHELQKMIHEHQDLRLAERSETLRAQIDAMAEDTKGRSKGMVVPYCNTGGQTDVVTRERVAAPAPAAAKK
jgi:hypothetical protein